MDISREERIRLDRILHDVETAVIYLRYYVVCGGPGPIPLLKEAQTPDSAPTVPAGVESVRLTVRGLAESVEQIRSMFQDKT